MAEGRVWRGACVVGGVHGGGHAWQGGMHSGGCVWQGVGMHGRGHAWQGRVCGGGHARQGGMHGGGWGVCMPHMPPPPPTLQGTVGQGAGGTHPIGIHSC